MLNSGKQIISFLTKSIRRAPYALISQGGLPFSTAQKKLTQKVLRTQQHQKLLTQSLESLRETLMADSLSKDLSFKDQVIEKTNLVASSVYDRLSKLCTTIGDYAGAIELAQRAVNHSEKALEESHPQTINQIYSLSKIYKASGDMSSATEYFYKMKFDLYDRMAALCKEEKKYEDALYYFEKMEDIAMKLGKLDYVKDLLLIQADLHEKLENSREAILYYEKSLQLHKNMKSSDFLHELACIETLARLHEKTSDFVEAAKYYTEAFEIRRNYLRSNKLVLYAFCKKIIEMHKHTGNLQEMEKYLKIGAKMAKKN